MKEQCKEIISSGMTIKSFSVILSVLVFILLLSLGLGQINLDVIITKIVNITLLLLFTTLQSFFWLGRSNLVDEEIFKNPIAIAVYIGLFAVSVAITIIA